MSWNYRVIKRGVIELGEPIDWYEIYSVYYFAKKGGEGIENITGWSSTPDGPHGESLEELIACLEMMRKAAEKPVLDLAELEANTGKPRPHWLTATKEIEDFAEMDEGWDGHHAAKPLTSAIDEAISFCAAAEFGIVHLEATLHVDGSILLELGDDGSEGSLRFRGDQKIVYACGPDVGHVEWDTRTVPQALREVLTRAAHRPEPGADPDATAPNNPVCE